MNDLHERDLEQMVREAFAERTAGIEPSAPGARVDAAVRRDVRLRRSVAVTLAAVVAVGGVGAGASLLQGSGTSSVAPAHTSSAPSGPIVEGGAATGALRDWPVRGSLSDNATTLAELTSSGPLQGATLLYAGDLDGRRIVVGHRGSGASSTGSDLGEVLVAAGPAGASADQLQLYGTSNLVDDVAGLSVATRLRGGQLLILARSHVTSVQVSDRVGWDQDGRLRRTDWHPVALTNGVGLTSLRGPSARAGSVAINGQQVVPAIAETTRAASDSSASIGTGQAAQDEQSLVSPARELLTDVYGLDAGSLGSASMTRAVPSRFCGSLLNGAASASSTVSAVQLSAGGQTFVSALLRCVAADGTGGAIEPVQVQPIPSGYAGAAVVLYGPSGSPSTDAYIFLVGQGLSGQGPASLPASVQCLDRAGAAIGTGRVDAAGGGASVRLSAPGVSCDTVVGLDGAGRPTGQRWVGERPSDPAGQSTISDASPVTGVLPAASPSSAG